MSSRRGRAAHAIDLTGPLTILHARGWTRAGIIRAAGLPEGSNLSRWRTGLYQCTDPEQAARIIALADTPDSRDPARQDLTEPLRKLHAMGISDHQIADAVDTARTNIYGWRRHGKICRSEVIAAKIRALLDDPPRPDRRVGTSRGVNLAEPLAVLRDLGWTDLQIADELDTSRSIVTRWRTGKASCRSDRITAAVRRLAADQTPAPTRTQAVRARPVTTTPRPRPARAPKPAPDAPVWTPGPISPREAALSARTKPDPQFMTVDMVRPWIPDPAYGNVTAPERLRAKLAAWGDWDLIDALGVAA